MKTPSCLPGVPKQTPKTPPLFASESDVSPTAVGETLSSLAVMRIGLLWRQGLWSQPLQKCLASGSAPSDQNLDKNVQAASAPHAKAESHGAAQGPGMKPGLSDDHFGIPNWDKNWEVTQSNVRQPSLSWVGDLIRRVEDATYLWKEAGGDLEVPEWRSNPASPQTSVSLECRPPVLGSCILGIFYFLC